MRLNIRRLLLQIVNLILGVVSIFLLGRIILKLLSANPTTPFVNWVYRSSDQLLSPFAGMFSSLSVGGVGVLDMVAVVGLLVYLVIGYLVISLITAVTTPVIETTDRYGIRHYHEVDRK